MKADLCKIFTNTPYWKRTTLELDISELGSTSDLFNTCQGKRVLIDEMVQDLEIPDRCHHPWNTC